MMAAPGSTNAASVVATVAKNATAEMRMRRSRHGFPSLCCPDGSRTVSGLRYGLATLPRPRPKHGVYAASRMDRITVVSLRGGREEARHRVHAVAVADGKVVAACGDPALVTFFRSSAKPLQALPVVRARPDLDDAEIAIACASHLASPRTARARAAPPREGGRDARTTSSAGRSRRRLEHNCSGKHAAMLLLCRVNGAGRREGYRLAAHPVPAGDARRGRSRCRGRARSTADRHRRVRGRDLRADARADGARVLATRALDGGARVADAMRAHPELIRGDGAADTELMRPRRRLDREGRRRGPALRGPRRARRRAQGRGRGAARRPQRDSPRSSRGSASTPATSRDVPVENSRGEVVGELRRSPDTSPRVNKVDLFPNRTFPD